MSLAASIQITDQDVFQTYANKQSEKYAQLACTPDGRVFAYSQAGASNLVAGQLTQSPAIVANDSNRTLSVAASTGQNQVTITLGGTATTDQYSGGWLTVVSGTGQGTGAYAIVGNTAATAGTSNSTVITVKGFLNVALDTTSVVSLSPNLYRATVQHTASSAIPTTGVPVVPVTAAFHYWSQVGGYASVLSDGAVTKNAMAIPSASVAGAVTIDLAATVTESVGFAPELTIDTKYSPLVLTIAG